MENRTAVRITLKILISFFLILAAIGIILSNCDRKGEYRAEKVFWQINQQLESLSKDLKRAPQASFDQLIQDYDEFISDFKYSNLVLDAKLLRARVYSLKGQHDKARILLEDFIQEYREYKNASLSALIEIGRTYEAQGNGEKLIENDYRIISEHPLSRYGLTLPLRIIKYYQSTHHIDRQKEALDSAVSHYNKIISEHPNKGEAFQALNALTVVYISVEKWNDAINALHKILMEYGGTSYLSPNILDKIIRTINTLSITKLNDYKKPILIYEEFIQRFPEHEYNRSLKEIITSLEGASRTNY